MAASQLQGVILTAMHDAPVPARLQGVILSAMHDAPVQAARLQGVILSAMHDAPTGREGLVGQAQVDQLGLVGSSVRVRRPQE